MELTNQIIFLIGFLLLISIFASVVSVRLGAPMLLVFLFVGMVAGEEGMGLMFQDVQLAHLIGSAALAIILFDGGLRTQSAQFRVGLRPALSLATLGVVLTAALVAVAARWLLPLSWFEAFLLGAIISSTDAAAVFNLLHTAKLELKQRVGATLEIESGTNDPMAIFLTIALVEIVASQQSPSGWALPLQFLQQMGVGTLAGIVGGRMLVGLVNRLRLSSVALYPLLALSGGLVVFSVTTWLGGSGFLAIYLAGLILGNSRIQSAQDIRRFHDGMAWLSQITMFLVLGLLVTPSELLDSAPVAIVIGLVLIFIARPLAVLLSLLPFRFSWREQGFIGWVGLRGAVPIILALFPLLLELPQAHLFFNVTFFVVIVSLLIQGWTVAPVARWLGMEIPHETNLVRRIELDLPGQPDFELVAYDIREGSPALDSPLQALNLPENAVLSAVMRDGRLLSPEHMGRLCPGDHVYVMTPTADLAAVDRELVSVSLPEHLTSQAFFGEFVLDGEARLQDLALAYGFKAPEGKANLTLHELLVERFGTPVVGDRLRLKPVELVVRQLDGARVTRVGLKIA